MWDSVLSEHPRDLQPDRFENRAIKVRKDQCRLIADCVSAHLQNKICQETAQNFAGIQKD